MASARQPTIPHMHVPNGVCKVLGTDPTVGRSRRGQAGKRGAARPQGLRCRVGRCWPACPPYCAGPWDTGCGGDHPHACRKPSLTVRENFAHHWSTGLRDARLDRPSSWGLGCETGGLVGGLSRQEIPRGKKRHMLHQYKVSGCLNEPSAETLFEI